jgi:hypothetical protein
MFDPDITTSWFTLMTAGKQHSPPPSDSLSWKSCSLAYATPEQLFSKTLEENQKWTHRVLEIIRKETLFLKPEKCTFDAQEVDYLGMIIHPRQVAMDPAKLSGISQWQTPSSVKKSNPSSDFATSTATSSPITPTLHDPWSI